jgi:DNA-binding transcriptional ArsR family regulator
MSRIPSSLLPAWHCIDLGSTEGKTRESVVFFPEVYIKRSVKVLKLISEESKLRIMLLLAKEGPLIVNEIAELLEMNKTTVSHHLSLLRNAELVTAEREGKKIFYDVNEIVWREMGKQFFDYLQKGDNIHFLGKFILKRLNN